MAGLYDLKSKLGHGARPNKYMITITRIGGSDISTLGKAASLPGKTIGMAEVWSQGRKLPLAGDTAFDTWDVTFYNDEFLSIRSRVEAWMRDIDDVQYNGSPLPNISGYGADMFVEQLDRTGASSAGVYRFYNAWPTSISAVDLGSDTNDQVSEFTVTFAYSHWEHS